MFIVIVTPRTGEEGEESSGPSIASARKTGGTMAFPVMSDTPHAISSTLPNSALGMTGVRMSAGRE